MLLVVNSLTPSLVCPSMASILLIHYNIPFTLCQMLHPITPHCLPNFQAFLPKYRDTPTKQNGTHHIRTHGPSSFCHSRRLAPDCFPLLNLSSIICFNWVSFVHPKVIVYFHVTRFRNPNLAMGVIAVTIAPSINLQYLIAIPFQSYMISFHLFVANLSFPISISSEPTTKFQLILTSFTKPPSQCLLVCLNWRKYAILALRRRSNFPGINPTKSFVV